MKLSEMPNQSKEDKIKESYDNLKDCSSNELMERLQKEIAKQKKNGTFDYDALLNTFEKIKIYLPDETYKNMLRIIDALKWI